MAILRHEHIATQLVRKHQRQLVPPGPAACRGAGPATQGCPGAGPVVQSAYISQSRASGPAEPARHVRRSAVVRQTCMGNPMGDGPGAGRLHVFRSLAGNAVLLRVLAAYVLFILIEYAVWIAMLVFAYTRGGAVTAGVVAVAQLAPAAVVAPVVAPIADRRSPVALLAGGYLVQTAAVAATAAAVFAGQPLAGYAAVAVAATAMVTTRPAQSALIPSVSATPDQLTAANVVAGWLEAAGVAAAGLLTGVLISLAGVGSVFVVCAGLGVVAVLLVAGLRAAPLAATGEAATATPASPPSPAPNPAGS